MDPDARIRQTLDAATRRLQLLELDNPKDAHYATRWRRKPGAKFHPLWKLIAQISFGIHLLHQRIAKSEEEVIRILQTHVDEVDGFLEDTGEDFDLAMRDIDERLRLLLLPLEHGKTFNKMLRDRDFRKCIIEGNDIIERICIRTSKAMTKSLDDVERGLEAAAELAKFLDRLGKDWNEEDEDMLNVYTAMSGNAEGWSHAFLNIKKKGEKLKRMIRRLERIVTEVEKQAGMASRRKLVGLRSSHHHADVLLTLDLQRQKDATNEASSDKTLEGVSLNPSTTYETPAELSRVASPTHSQSASSWRASLNKPLPPDPQSRLSKQFSGSPRKNSKPTSNTEQSSSDFHSVAEQPSGGPVRSAKDAPSDKSSTHLTHSPKASQDSRTLIESLPEIIIAPNILKEQYGTVSPCQVPLPPSPARSRKPSQEEAPLGITLESKRDISPAVDKSEEPSSEELLQEVFPKAHVTDLYIPPDLDGESQVPEKHKSASIVEAYNQSRSPSCSGSQCAISKPSSTHTTENKDGSSRDSGPPRISLHFAYADQLQPSPLSSTFKNAEQFNANGLQTVSSKDCPANEEPVPSIPQEIKERFERGEGVPLIPLGVDGEIVTKDAYILTPSKKAKETTENRPYIPPRPVRARKVAANDTPASVEPQKSENNAVDHMETPNVKGEGAVTAPESIISSPGKAQMPAVSDDPMSSNIAQTIKNPVTQAFSSGVEAAGEEVIEPEKFITSTPERGDEVAIKADPTPRGPARPQIKRKEIGTPPRRRTEEKVELSDLAGVTTKLGESKKPQEETSAIKASDIVSQLEPPSAITKDSEEKEKANQVNSEPRSFAKQGAKSSKEDNCNPQSKIEPDRAQHSPGIEHPKTEPVRLVALTKLKESIDAAVEAASNGTQDESNARAAAPKISDESPPRASMSSISRTRHSISSVGTTVALESIAVQRPHSNGSDRPPMPKRSVSVKALAPVINGLGDSDLPEIVVEPHSLGIDTLSNQRSASPATPPLVPDRSPARSSPRSGGRSPVSYKLMPNVQTPPPNDPESAPKTALPQWPKAESSKRFKKPSMNVFRGVLFKKNSSKQMRAGGLGGNVAMA